MARKLYVGNLNFRTSEERVREVFGQYGQVTAVNLITDRETGKPRGFGFVEMDSEESARAAITGLNGQTVDGRAITVAEARPQKEREGGQRGGRGGGGGGRGGYGGGYGGDSRW